MFDKETVAVILLILLICAVAAVILAFIAGVIFLIFWAAGTGLKLAGFALLGVGI